MLHKRTLAALLVASLSAGCAVGPDYVRPPIALPGQFQERAIREQPLEKAPPKLDHQ